MRLEKYNSYQDTGVVWLPKIPAEWQVKRVKDLADYQSGDYIDSNEFSDEGIFPVYGGNGLRGYTTKYNHNGDYILIGRQGALCGNINYAASSFWATEHAVVVYKKKNVNLFWFGELLRVMNLNQYSLSAAQPGLSVEKIKRLELPYVSNITQQNQIAQYLDRKTAAIDQKINLLQQKHARYLELRKSLINETVCRGLNKNAPLKDSGIEWIGKIPEHWKKIRLKDIGFLYSGLSGKSGSDFNQENNKNNRGFIQFTNIANNTYLNPNILGTVAITPNEKQNKVKSGDLFFLMSSEGYEDIGKTALLKDEVPETYLNSFCKGFRIFDKQHNSAFLNYQLLSETYRHILIVEGKGFTRINLKMEKVSDFSVFTPPYIEQTQIAQYLDTQTIKIDQITNNIKLQIAALKELRGTLINDIVTGKYKVPENIM